MSIESMLVSHGETCTIQRSSKTRSLTGSLVSGAWTTVKELTGWIQSATSQTVIQYGQRNVRATHIAYFATDPVAREGDRLLASSGKTFSILGFRNQAGLDRLYSVVLKSDDG